MKMFLIVVITVAVLGDTTFSQIVSERQAAAQRSANPKGETPFYCDRTALTPEQSNGSRNWVRCCAHLALGSRNYRTGLSSSFRT